MLAKREESIYGMTNKAMRPLLIFIDGRMSAFSVSRLRSKPATDGRRLLHRLAFLNASNKFSKETNCWQTPPNLFMAIMLHPVNCATSRLFACLSRPSILHRAHKIGWKWLETHGLNAINVWPLPNADWRVVKIAVYCGCKHFPQWLPAPPAEPTPVFRPM